MVYLEASHSLSDIECTCTKSSQSFSEEVDDQIKCLLSA